VGCINVVPGRWDPQWVPATLLLYGPPRERSLTVVFEDEGEPFRHAIDLQGKWLVVGGVQPACLLAWLLAWRYRHAQSRCFCMFLPLECVWLSNGQEELLSWPWSGAEGVLVGLSALLLCSAACSPCPFASPAEFPYATGGS